MSRRQLLRFRDGEARRLTADPPLPGELTLFGTKFTKGGDAADAVLPISEVLATSWPADAHFTCYVHPDETRLTKDRDTAGIRFDAAAIDLDFGDHQTQRPTETNFDELLSIAEVIDESPNIIYQTRGGGRWVYLIQPLHDPGEFEAGLHGLIDQLAILLTRSESGYEVDAKARDWTRLYRCPRVVRDGVEEFDHDIRLLHDSPLNLANYKRRGKKRTAQRKSPRRLTVHQLQSADQRYISALRYVKNTEPAVSGEGGHNRTFAVTCRLLQHYALEAEQVRELLDVFNDRCEPPWSDRELGHKVESALQAIEKGEP